MLSYPDRLEHRLLPEASTALDGSKGVNKA